MNGFIPSLGSSHSHISTQLSPGHCSSRCYLSPLWPFSMTVFKTQLERNHKSHNKRMSHRKNQERTKTSPFTFRKEADYGLREIWVHFPSLWQVLEMMNLEEKQYLSYLTTMEVSGQGWLTILLLHLRWDKHFTTGRAWWSKSICLLARKQERSRYLSTISLS